LLGLNTSSNFISFIEKNFNFYAGQYLRLRKASEGLLPGFEPVFYNAQNNFTLQYPVLLAPLLPSDNELEIEKKIQIVSSYIDILITWRIWNFRAIDYSTMQYAMFIVMRDIRGKKADKVTEYLLKKLKSEQETFATNERFRLHGQNRRQIHLLLARIIDHLEFCFGMRSHYEEYIRRSGRQGYEVEHIWANHPERHRDEFTHPADFEEYRNRIGGLLLLPKSFNASYSDLPFEEKVEHYNSQNLLARSLHANCYKHNPCFL